MSQDEWDRNTATVVETEFIEDYKGEWDGEYLTLENGRIVRSHITGKGVQEYEYVEEIPEARVEEPEEEEGIGAYFEKAFGYAKQGAGIVWDGTKATVDFLWLDDARTVLDGEAPITKRIISGVSFIPVGKIFSSVRKGYKLGESAYSFGDVIKKGQKMPKHIEVKNKTSLPGKGEPNSSADLLNPDGTVKQRRYYDENGKAKEDIDFNHSDDGTHSFPHRHKWDWSKKPPRQNSE